MVIGEFFLQLMAKFFTLQKQMKENLIRMVYCEMLGHDASFGFMHAVKYTERRKLMDKKLGISIVKLDLN